MKKAKRVFLTVLDSFGIGYEPDAHLFGDVGANTLRSISKADGFNIPNLVNLGLGNVDGVDSIDKCENPTGSYARLRELSMGKDTTVGHWELMGLVSESPLPTYPDGFPKEILDKFSAATGRGVLCNKPYSGTDVIRDYGKQHIASGDLIVYTSADSVFQIAAHEDIVPLEELYECCRKAREILVGEHGVGRVIARPFVTAPDGSFKRSANRHDFSLVPPKKTALAAIKEAGLDVIAIGKITDIFAGDGITETIFTHGNTEGIATTLEIAKRDFNGFCFTNLVDFDMLYGHRQDVQGYANAMMEFDRSLPALINEMGEDDLLIITADHGCDPDDSHTDHTREYIPFLVYRKGAESINFGTLDGFAHAGKLVCDALGVEYDAGEVESLFEKM